MVSFVDQVTLHVRAGNGADGCVSIKRKNSSHWLAQMAAMVETAEASHFWLMLT